MVDALTWGLRSLGSSGLGVRSQGQWGLVSRVLGVAMLVATCAAEAPGAGAGGHEVQGPPWWIAGLLFLFFFGVLCTWHFMVFRRRLAFYRPWFEELRDWRPEQTTRKETPPPGTWEGEVMERSECFQAISNLNFSEDGTLWGFGSDKEGNHRILGKWDARAHKLVWLQIYVPEGEEMSDVEVEVQQNLKEVDVWARPTLRQSPFGHSVAHMKICEGPMYLAETAEGLRWSMAGKKFQRSGFEIGIPMPNHRPLRSEQTPTLEQQTSNRKAQTQRLQSC